MFQRLISRLAFKLAPVVAPIWRRLPRSARDKLKVFVLPTTHANRRRTKANKDKIQILDMGINVYGLFDSPIGIGEAARSIVRSLEFTSIPFAPVTLTPDNLFKGRRLGETKAPYGINLFCINPDCLDFAIQSIGIEKLEAPWNIGYWAWETANFPEHWRDWCYQFNEIWLCSQFASNTIARECSANVITVPYCIEPPPALRANPREFGVPDGRPFVLCGLDVASYPERKNPSAVIETMRLLKSHPARPVLVVKVGGVEADPAFMSHLQRQLSQIDHILLTGWFDREKMWRLLASCDAVISLHRGEGFGLWLAEAMSLGKPVIATGYSGNLEFMNVSNSFLVRYDLTQIKSDVGPYQKGTFWADPDIHHAAELLSQVWDNTRLTKIICKHAADDIRTHFSAHRIGEILSNRIKLIIEQLN